MKLKHLLPILLLSTAAYGSELNWPSFRGDGTSISLAKDVPVTWSQSQNIAWSIDLPGYGQSSPIIWGDKVFITSVEGDTKQTLHVTAINLKDGKGAWKKTLQGTQGVKDSDYVSKAVPTPAADAKHVYAFFESGDVIALSHDGNVAWQRSLVKDYGNFEGNHGIGSSLAQTSQHIIVLIDHSGECYLAALNKQSGKTDWLTKRTQRVAWSSPVVTKTDDKERIIVSSNGTVEEFDATTGNRLWLIAGIDGNTVPSAAVTESHVYIGSSKLDNNLAITRGQQPAIQWRAEKVTTTFCSPLVVAHRYYTVNRAGVAFCVDTRTGKTLWQQRVATSCWASPVFADRRIYFFCKDGTTIVAKDSDTFEQLASNTLPTEGRVYGVAMVDGHIVLRTGKNLICIRNNTEK